MLSLSFTNHQNHFLIDSWKQRANPLAIIFCLVAFGLILLTKEKILYSSIIFSLLLIYFLIHFKKYPWLAIFICGPIIMWIFQNWYYCNLSDLNYHYDYLIVKVIKKTSNYGIIKAGHQYLLWPNMPNDFIVGQRIVLTGTIKALKPAQNSFSFDFSFYLSSQKVFKNIIVEKYQFLKTHNLRFIFFNFWTKTNSSTLINFLLWQEPTNLPIKSQLVDLNLTYLLHLAFLTNVIFIKSLSKRFNWKPNKYLVLWLYFCFGFYLYLLSFPWFLFRFFLNKILNLLLRKFSWNLNPITTKFVGLNLLYLFNAHYILQSGIWYLVVMAIFFTKNSFQKKFWYSWKGFFLKSWSVFIPLQIIFNYRLNFLAPGLALLFLPWFQWLYFLIFVGWWWPHFQEFWNFWNNISTLFLNISVKTSFSWNFGATPKLLWLFYFWLLLKCFDSYNFRQKRIYVCLMIIYLLFIIFWPKLILESESFWMLNVGNGSSFLYVNKWKNTVIIYDCGSGPGYSANTMADFLKFKGLNHVNFLFISHFHIDHYNGLEAIQKITKVQHLINNQTQGLLEWSHKGISCFGWKLENQKDYNDTSLVILLITKSKRILLVGDLTKVGEYEYLKNTKFIEMITHSRIDLLQIGHHGSKNASSESFLSLINPRLIFISAGLKNKHQFPDPETTEILNKLKIPFVSTHIKINWVFNLQKTKLKSFF